MIEFIDIKNQYAIHKTEIDQRIQKVLDHGQFIMGPEIQELESWLADYVGVKHCISVGSGTHSLEIALRALGVGIGDEVITVPFSWISSAEVISLVGATPVFVDIEPETYTMNPLLLENVITPKTKAIIPVSMFGQIPDMEAINTIASKYGIPVVEDGAQSFGASRSGTKSCGTSLIGSTSFFPAKPLGCYGDGGALFTNDDKLAEIMRAIRSHGGVVRHHHTHVGTNGRMDTLQAAIVMAKVPYFADEVKARERIGAEYSALLEGHVVTPKVNEGGTHVYAQYTIRVAADKRARLIEILKSQGIPTGIYYPKCFHEQPVFEYLGYKKGDFPESELAADEVLSLPMHPFLTEADLRLITVSVINALKNSSVGLIMP